MTTRELEALTGLPVAGKALVMVLAGGRLYGRDTNGEWFEYPDYPPYQEDECPPEASTTTRRAS